MSKSIEQMEREIAYLRRQLRGIRTYGADLTLVPGRRHDETRMIGAALMRATTRVLETEVK